MAEKKFDDLKGYSKEEIKEFLLDTSETKIDFEMNKKDKEDIKKVFTIILELKKESNELNKKILLKGIHRDDLKTIRFLENLEKIKELEKDKD